MVPPSEGKLHPRCQSGCGSFGGSNLGLGKHLPISRGKQMFERDLIVD